MHAAKRPTLRPLILGLIGLALLFLLWREQHRMAAPQPTDSTSGAQPSGSSAAGPHGLAGAPLPGAGLGEGGQPRAGGASGASDESAAQRAERLRMAEERLSTYRKFAQYPPGSRPAREHPDQLFPTAPVVRGTPLSLGGRPSEHIVLKLRQDRLVVVGNESIELGLRCEDSQAQVLPCSVEKAEISALPLPAPAAGAAAPRKPAGPRPVEFVEDSRSEHRGELLATLRPADLALVDTTWPLRVDVTIKAGRDPVEQGAALFDFLFTPEPPAVSTGAVREAVVAGSLMLSYPLTVRRPGRYLLHVRVDDANGKPLAYLESNSVLPAGPQQVPFTVFGKLILDEKPAFPLKVRDFDGYLLKEDVDPDREQIPTRAGYHHTTQVYSLSAFSAAEWQSEEKTRHEREFEKDVAQAR